MEAGSQVDREKKYSKRRKQHAWRREEKNRNTRMEDIQYCWWTKYEWRVKRAYKERLEREAEARTRTQSFVLGLIKIGERERVDLISFHQLVKIHKKSEECVIHSSLNIQAIWASIAEYKIAMIQKLLSWSIYNEA